MLPTSSNVQVKIARALPAGIDALAVFATEVPPTQTPRNLGKAIAEGITVIRRADPKTGVRSKLSTTLVELGGKPVHVIVAGLGTVQAPAGSAVREAAGSIAKAARKRELKSVAIVLPQLPDSIDEDVAQAIVEGFVVASFRYREYRSSNGADKNSLMRLTLIASSSLEDAVDRGRIIAEAQNFARTVAFRPGNDINPVTLAAVAKEAAGELGLKYRVLDERQLAKLKMGGLLAVGSGASLTPPRLIVLEHSPRRAKGEPILLVGKAITFDTGGISIKPAEKMGRMVFDKCGGMAVLGTMAVVARLKLPLRVIGILAAAENHISERAYRPGDILRMHNGVTVEVTNTDAEGRLVLGDAMSWGIREYRPRYCVDLATLTGGVSVALGRTMAGVMGNDQFLIDRLIQAGKAAGEKMWQLPLPEEPREMLKSEFADVVNSAGRDAHPLQGAAFLSLFLPAKDTLPWAHLDIAGVADTEKESPLYVKGATGWGVRTLIQWLSELR